MSVGGRDHRRQDFGTSSFTARMVFCAGWRLLSVSDDCFYYVYSRHK